MRAREGHPESSWCGAKWRQELWRVVGHYWQTSGCSLRSVVRDRNSRACRKYEMQNCTERGLLEGVEVVD